MGSVSYSAHISNGKCAITSKSKLQGVAMHNLRKYKSEDYSSENIILLEGTENLYQDVRNIYQEEFDDAVREYNEKQKRPERRIDDYFEHVAKLDQDMAVEIIFQCGDKQFWEEHNESKEKMFNVYRYVLSRLKEYLPDFKVANAVIHFDEASPHMHVVGIPVWSGTKKGLSKKVSKRNVFTPATLSVVLQDKLREEARSCFRFNIHEMIGEKKKGRNHDLSVAEYKVQQEIQNLQMVESKKQLLDTSVDSAKQK
jgi:cation transport regulator ChaB